MGFIKKVLNSGRKRFNQLHCVISIRYTVHVVCQQRLSLQSMVVRFGGQQSAGCCMDSVWRSQMYSSCLSRTCNEAVKGDTRLDSLQGCNDKANLKWWYKHTVWKVYTHTSF